MKPSRDSAPSAASEKLCRTLIGRTRPCDAAVLGHIGDAAGARGFGRIDPSPSCRSRRISPCSAGVMPNSACASSLRPEPTRPARPTISPARTSRLTSLVIGWRTRSRASSTGAPIGTDDLGKEVLDAAPDHHLDELGGVRVGHLARADIGAVAQHRDAVGDLEDLVEPMADVDDPDAARLEPAHDVEQARHVGSPSARRSARP